MKHLSEEESIICRASLSRVFILSLSPKEIIKKFNLIPHPNEGGFYLETYRSSEKFSLKGLPGRYAQDKSFCTAIYYLLSEETYSHMHRLKTDEIFHFYYGDPVEMLHLYPDGSGKIFLLGNQLSEKQQPQVVVPSDTWQGCKLREGGKVALLGATVSPGFDFCDYEHGGRKSLIGEYPEFQDLISQLTER